MLILQIFPVSKHKSFLYLAFTMYLNLTIKSSIKYSIKVGFDSFFKISGQVFRETSLQDVFKTQFTSFLVLYVLSENALM